MKIFNKKLYKIIFSLLLLVLLILLVIYIFFNNVSINIVNTEKEYYENTIITKVYVDNIPLSINRRKEEFDKVINDLNIKNNYGHKYNYEVRFIKNVFKYNEVQEYYIGIFKYNGENSYYGIKNFLDVWKGIKNEKMINKKGIQLIYFYEELYNTNSQTLKIYVDDYSLNVNKRKEEFDEILKILYEDKKMKYFIDLMKKNGVDSIKFLKLKNGFYNTEVTSLNFRDNEYSEIGAYYKIGEINFQDNKKNYEIIDILGKSKYFIEKIN